MKETLLPFRFNDRESKGTFIEPNEKDFLNKKYLLNIGGTTPEGHPSAVEGPQQTADWTQYPTGWSE